MKKLKFSFLFLLFLLSTAGCTSFYVFSDLGTLGGAFSEARDINEHDHIVGSSETEDGSVHAFLIRNGSMIDLGTLGGANSWALGINDDDVVVGSSELADGRIHAFIWRDGVMTDIHDPAHPSSSEPDSSRAVAINNDRWITGNVGISGVVWRTIDDVEFLSGSVAGPKDAYDINNEHQIVGWHHSVDQAFVWEDGMMTLLPHDVPPAGSRAYAINNSGLIVGWEYTLPHGFKQAALFQVDDLPVLLGTLGGDESRALDINDNGLVVGHSDKTEGSNVPFYYDPDEGSMRELMSLGDGMAFAVNNRKIIVGKVKNSTGEYRAVKWYLTRWRF
ncbi:MAG: hypothetical protein AB2535_04010 [Candidatus Thiodiazotropha endolucinida]